MRTAPVVVVVLASVVWCVGMATAAPPAAAPGPCRAGARDLVPIWSQIQNFSGVFNAYSSEHRTSDGFWCESADDFRCTGSDTITMVDWWGFERELPAGGVPEFMIRFCEDDSTGRYHYPGDIVYEEHVLDFTAQYLAPVEKYYYSCALPVGFAPTPGKTYWISIIAVHASPLAQQQWAWYDCIPDDYWGAEAAMRSEFFGNPDWISWSLRPYGNYVEHAFILYAGGDSPVERSSWTKLKAMFK